MQSECNGALMSTLPSGEAVGSIDTGARAISKVAPDANNEPISCAARVNAVGPAGIEPATRGL